MDAKLLSVKLKTLRADKGWTQEQVAQTLFVTRQTVSKWENNINDPDLSTIVRLCDLYKVTLDYLLRDDCALIDKLAHKEKSYRKMITAVIVLSVVLLLVLASVGFNVIG